MDALKVVQYLHIFLGMCQQVQLCVQKTMAALATALFQNKKNYSKKMGQPSKICNKAAPTLVFASKIWFLLKNTLKKLIYIYFNLRSFISRFKNEQWIAWHWAMEPGFKHKIFKMFIVIIDPQTGKLISSVLVTSTDKIISALRVQWVMRPPFQYVWWPVSVTILKLYHQE